MTATNKQVAENLIRAADLVAAGNWVQKAWAVDRTGHDVLWTDPKACKFCAVSSLRVTDGYSETKPKTAGRAIDAVESFLFGPNRILHNEHLLVWNDEEGRTAEQVETIFRRTAHCLHPDIDKSLLETQS